MIKRIRDFNQKNSLVWKRDTLRQARLIPPPPTSDKPIYPPPSVTATATPVVAPHEYAWANQGKGMTLKWATVSLVWEKYEHNMRQVYNPD